MYSEAQKECKQVQKRRRLHDVLRPVQMYSIQVADNNNIF